MGGNRKAREHVSNDTSKTLNKEDEKVYIKQIDSHVTGRDMHAIKPGQGSELLGFGSVPDPVEDFRDNRREDRRPARGRGERGPRAAQGGRKGKIVTEEDFPSL